MGLSGVQFIKYFVPSIDILEGLFREFDDNKTEVSDSNKLSFKENPIKNLSYAYPDQNNDALQNINMLINKGELIGIIGKSGSGKHFNKYPFKFLDVKLNQFMWMIMM